VCNTTAIFTSLTSVLHSRYSQLDARQQCADRYLPLALSMLRLCLFLAFFWSLSRSRLASSSEKGGSAARVAHRRIDRLDCGSDCPSRVKLDLHHGLVYVPVQRASPVAAALAPAPGGPARPPLSVAEARRRQATGGYKPDFARLARRSPKQHPFRSSIFREFCKSI
jgi:hypothetical protein